MLVEIGFEHKMEVAEPPHSHCESGVIVQSQLYMVFFRHCVVWVEVNNVGAHTCVQQEDEVFFKLDEQPLAPVLN